MATVASRNAVARAFRALHKPRAPLVLPNVYDGVSARAVATLPAASALATASWAIAAAAGTSDSNLTFEAQLAAVRAISPIAKQAGKPLSVDWQDGYGDRLEDGVRALIDLDVAGINLEDYDGRAGRLFTTDEATNRIQRVLDTAAAEGVPDFVVNARADPLLHGGVLAEVAERGRAYLAAGATTVFVLGGQARGGISRAEVVELVRAFGGMLNVSLRLADNNNLGGYLNMADLREIGVARVSIGPQLQFIAAKAMTGAAQKILDR